MYNNTNVFDCNIIKLPKIHNRAGNITPLEAEINLPFKTKRIFYLYDIPGGETRGAHAHKQCHQFIIAASGSFEVLLDDGKAQRVIQLNRPYMGIHILPNIWASEINFSSGSICLVLASHKYDMKDYVRNYDEFLEIKKNRLII